MSLRSRLVIENLRHPNRCGRGLRTTRLVNILENLISLWATGKTGLAKRFLKMALLPGEIEGRDTQSDQTIECGQAEPRAF
jgi:hypothetical protein